MGGRGADTSPVHKLLGNFSATLGFFSNFQLVEQLSVHRHRASVHQFLYLNSHSHAPIASGTRKKFII